MIVVYIIFGSLALLVVWNQALKFLERRCERALLREHGIDRTSLSKWKTDFSGVTQSGVHWTCRRSLATFYDMDFACYYLEWEAELPKAIEGVGVMSTIPPEVVLEGHAVTPAHMLYSHLLCSILRASPGMTVQSAGDAVYVATSSPTLKDAIATAFTTSFEVDGVLLQPWVLVSSKTLHVGVEVQEANIAHVVALTQWSESAMSKLSARGLA